MCAPSHSRPTEHVAENTVYLADYTVYCTRVPAHDNAMRPAVAILLVVLRLAGVPAHPKTQGKRLPPAGLRLFTGDLKQRFASVNHSTSLISGATATTTIIIINIVMSSISITHHLEYHHPTYDFHLSWEAYRCNQPQRLAAGALHSYHQ